MNKIVKLASVLTVLCCLVYEKYILVFWILKLILKILRYGRIWNIDIYSFVSVVRFGALVL